MKTPNVTVVETTVTDVVRNGWTGQVLGVECEARKEKDYVSCFLCCWSFYETVVLFPFVIMNLCLTPELECQGWVSPTPVAPQPCLTYDSSTTGVGGLVLKPIIPFEFQ